MTTAALENDERIERALREEAGPEERLAEYRRVSRLAYTTRNSEMAIVDHTGHYPRINFFQGADPEVVKDMFQFGYVNCIYLSEDFEEVKLLSRSIKDGLEKFREFHKNKNPLIFIKVFTASPELEGNQFIGASHIIQIGMVGKRDQHQIPEDQNFHPYVEEAVTMEWVQYRRALGFKVLYQHLDQCEARGDSWIYEANDKIIVKTALGSKTQSPQTAMKIKSEKMKIYQNLVRATKPTKKKICQLLKHDKKVCEMC